MNSNEYDSDSESETGVVCLLCQNPCTKIEFQNKVLTGKVVHNCIKYLHTSITENNFKERFNSAESVICPQCFASARRLVELDDQLEITQKSINDFLLIFSLKIIHQRTRRINGRQRNGIVKLDISKFPGVFEETDLPVNEVVDPLFLLSPYSDKEVKIENTEPENPSHQNETDEDEFTNQESSDYESTHLRHVSKELRIDLERLQFPLKTKATVIKPKKKTCAQKSHDSTIQRKSRGDSAELLQKAKSRAEKKSFLCSICGKFLKSAIQCKFHLRTHDPKPKQSYTCSHCKSVFTQRWILVRHMRSHNGESKTFSCNVCTKAFARNDYLTLHMRSHTGEKRYQCSICQNAYTRKGHLTTHMRKHTGERPFKCSVCERPFAQASVLTEHMKIHTGERPFKCSLCDKTYSRRQHLAKHMRTHKRELTYKCSSCSTSFPTNDELISHMNTHMMEKL